MAKGTGHGWAHWFGVLDRFGVGAKGHSAAASFLHERHRLGAWWAQMVVVGYERARGMRKVRETRTGFAATVTRTFAAAPEAILRCFADVSLARRWLPEGVAVHKVSVPKSARLTFSDGKKTVSASLTARAAGGGARTAVQMQHERLASDAACSKMKRVWSAALRRLETLLAGG
ncbi:MAG: hypothetical protein IBJ11_04605 [Phycisphaerales bacterium]|nr:hypothetical protein [Phycisphaerales bacterium]